VFERHFLPSAFLCTMIEQNNKKILDIGSGAGFPGIVLKIMRPDMEISLVDSSRKKYLFLTEVCEYLNLPCRIIHARMESYTKKTTETYDIITSRAVTTIKNLWDWSAPVLKDSGQLLVLKGSDITAELSDVNMNSVSVDQILPDNNWTKFCEYLENKIVVIMENKHV